MITRRPPITGNGLDFQARKSALNREPLPIKRLCQVYFPQGCPPQRTFTDSEGWSVTYDYDAADRITKKTYPDGTTDLYTYDKLDLVSYQDRQNRVWTYAYDANRRLTAVTDPAGA